MSIAADAVPGELVERFAAALDRLNPQGGKIGLAVSGGPDSMAMMLLAHAAMPRGFEVATVDHGLRPEARDECALAVAACEARGIPCEVLTVQVGEGNLQAQAREARYEALGAWAEKRGLSAIATAHHADDQAETLLMRLNRGSGVAGLAGVREIAGLKYAPAVRILRPLLKFRRAELAQVVASAGTEVAHDPSNEDDSFDRVRVRKALAEADWLDPLALAQSASNLADADIALSGLALDMWRRDGSARGARATLPLTGWTEIDARLLIVAAAHLGFSLLRSDAMTMIDRLRQGDQANVAGLLIRREADLYVLEPEPPRRTG